MPFRGPLGALGGLFPRPLTPSQWLPTALADDGVAIIESAAVAYHKDSHTEV